MSERAFDNENMCRMTYAAVIAACDEVPFTMELVGEDATAVEDAVNQGIDAHLEACFVPDRGDSYTPGRKLSCVVSPESLPVLLRRLFDADPCSSIGSGILSCLGFNDCGEYVGRED